jgi:hypothetical protein
LKLTCDRCGAVSGPEALRIGPDSVMFACGRCGAEVALGAPAAVPPAGGEGPVVEPPVTAKAPGAAAPDSAAAGVAPPGAALDVADLPPVKCPKCGHRQYDDEACHKCGLVFKNAERRRPWEEIPLEKRASVARVDTAWAKLMSGPRTTGEHDAFCEACLRAGVLDHGIRLYRLHLADHPDDAAAAAALAKLAAQAQAVIKALTQDGRASIQAQAARIKQFVVAVAVILCLGAMGILVKMWLYTRSLSGGP